MLDKDSFFEIIAKRRSVRVFTDEPVSRPDLERILEAATMAPSGTNSQPWRFVVVKTDSIRKKMAAAVEAKMDEILTWPETADRARRINAYRRSFIFFADAPIVIAALGKDHQTIVRKTIENHGIVQSRNRPSSAHLSVAAAIQNLILSASVLGYGTCWMTGPLIAAEEIEEILGVEEPWYLSSVVPLGRPAEQPPIRSRKGLDKVVTWIPDIND